MFILIDLILRSAMPFKCVRSLFFRKHVNPWLSFFPWICDTFKDKYHVYCCIPALIFALAMSNFCVVLGGWKMPWDTSSWQQTTGVMASSGPERKFLTFQGRCKNLCQSLFKQVEESSPVCDLRLNCEDEQVGRRLWWRSFVMVVMVPIKKLPTTIFTMPAALT